MKKLDVKRAEDAGIFDGAIKDRAVYKLADMDENELVEILREIDKRKKDKLPPDIIENPQQE